MQCIFRDEEYSSSGGQVQFEISRRVISRKIWNGVIFVILTLLKLLSSFLIKLLKLLSNFWYINSAVGRFVYVSGVGIYKHTLAISVTSSLGKAWLNILFNAEHIVSSSINNEHIFTACFMFHNEVTFTTLTVTLKCFPTSL